MAPRSTRSTSRREQAEVHDRADSCRKEEIPDLSQAIADCKDVVKGINFYKDFLNEQSLILNEIYADVDETCSRCNQEVIAINGRFKLLREQEDEFNSKLQAILKFNKLFNQQQKEINLQLLEKKIEKL